MPLYKTCKLVDGTYFADRKVKFETEEELTAVNIVENHRLLNNPAS
jgi:hypothetical protein